MPYPNKIGLEGSTKVGMTCKFKTIIQQTAPLFYNVKLCPLPL
jgi:hypothetical protein